ncbi:ankyrin repeat domain-containing protein [Thiotrichales bacterium 19S9-12]|nr:ankyrin repeat domain-containing protein [Thiotrichales bacterium 19S9-11]MCF6812465.1 ankyrin repeat domain-containing protein [Thiotrichales bacterium 19S9-12]
MSSDDLYEKIDQAIEAADYYDKKLIMSVLEDCDINQINDDGRTLLHLIIADDDESGIAKFLIEEDGRIDLNLNLQDHWGQTVLHLAINQGLEEIAMILAKDKRVNINLKNQWGNSPLHRAAEQGMTDVVEILIEKREAKINDINNAGQTPLELIAIRFDRGPLDFAKYLIKKGAKIDVTKEPIQRLMHLAALSNKSSLLRILIENDMPIDLEDDQGRTPLALANQYYNLKAAKVLLEYGADVKKKEKSAASMELFINYDQSEKPKKKKSSSCCVIS